MNLKSWRSVLAALAFLPLLAAPLLAGCSTEPAQAADFETAVGHYETIRVGLSEDSIEGVESAAKSLAKTAEAFAQSREAGAGDLAGIASEVAKSSAQVAAAGDIEAARQAFRQVSQSMIEWHAQAGAGPSEVAYCPMAAASWLQPGDEEIGNPYYGSSMLRCGSFVETGDEAAEESVDESA